MLTSLVLAIVLINTLAIAWLAVRSRHSIRAIWSRLESLQVQIQGVRMQMNEATNSLNSELASQFHQKRINFQSQSGEDVALWKFFDRKPSGTCIEVGAFDGKQCSNTYAFEMIGWDCVLIEPDPEMADRCRQNRPRSRVVQAAVGPAGASGNISFHKVRTSAEWSGMMSFTEINESHLEKCKAMGADIEKIEVPYRSLNEILAGTMQPIDFVSIDVEGHEMDVLAGFDLERFRPRVILTECTYDREQDQVGEYLRSKGYQLQSTIGCNQLYIRQ